MNHILKRYFETGILIACIFLCGCTAKSTLSTSESFEGKGIQADGQWADAKLTFSFKRDGTYVMRQFSNGTSFSFEEGTYTGGKGKYRLNPNRGFKAKFFDKQNFENGTPYQVGRVQKINKADARDYLPVSVESGKVMLGSIKLHPASTKLLNMKSEREKLLKNYKGTYAKLKKGIYELNRSGRTWQIAFNNIGFVISMNSKQNNGEYALANGAYEYNARNNRMKLTFGAKSNLYQGTDLVTGYSLRYSKYEEYPIEEKSFEVRTNFKHEGKLTPISNNKDTINSFHYVKSSEMKRKGLLYRDPHDLDDEARDIADADETTDDLEANESSSQPRDSMTEHDWPHSKEDYSNLNDSQKIDKFTRIVWSDFQQRIFNKRKVDYPRYGYTNKIKTTLQNGFKIWQLYKDHLTDDTTFADGTSELYGYDPDTGDLYRVTQEDSNTYSFEQFDSMNVTLPDIDTSEQ
ncbi:hypothetical protein [Lacticaseibacillus suihuaensis]